MKNILLLVPSGNGPGNQRKWNRSWPIEIDDIITANLWKVVTPGVLVLAALCDPSKFHVDLVDEEFCAVNTEVEYDIVAMYTVTPNAKKAYQWAEYFRKKGSHVVLGGVHALMCPDEAGQYADTLLLGECENIWPEFLNDFYANNPKSLYYQGTGEVDLSQSPVPTYELLPPNGRRIIPIQTSRGCPHGCKFCNIRSIYGKGYRTKPIENVKLEIEEALKVNKRAILYFTDDNFFCDKRRAKELVDTIRNYSVIWYAHSDISLGEDIGLLNSAYSSGCRQVLVGLESVNSANLSNIDENNFKYLHFASYKDLVNKIQASGIGVIGSFIVGLDHDDASIFKNINLFIHDVKIFGASITVNTPYPGTLMHNKLLEDQRILSYDWDLYTIFQLVIRPEMMTEDEFNDGYLWLVRDIYSERSIYERINHFKTQIKQQKMEQYSAVDSELHKQT